VLDLLGSAQNNTALPAGLRPNSFGITTLANIQSAKKRARQALKRRAHNQTLRSRVRSAIRKVLKAIASGDKAAAQATFKAVVPEIDRMAQKGILRKNRAAHYKSKLNAKLRAMS
jgi:small subunit ribosomal protein S20